MNFDYFRMLTYIEIRNFISKVLNKQFNTNFIVKITRCKNSSNSQQIEFEAIGSNGTYVTGIACCSDFECKMSLNQGKNQIDSTYTNEWAKWVYAIIKQKEFVSDSENKSIISHNFKQDYNEHCKKIRDAKLAKVEEECEASLLK